MLCTAAYVVVCMLIHCALLGCDASWCCGCMVNSGSGDVVSCGGVLCYRCARRDDGEAHCDM